MSDKLPNLKSIRHPKHPGVSVPVNESFSEAAEVCLSRHHNPPVTIFTVEYAEKKFNRSLDWKQPNDTAQRAWNNKDDATRDGAYIISLGISEKELNLVALSRADTRSGSDYYIGNPSDLDLESAYRLEISGLDSGDLQQIKSRFKQKCKQALKGLSSLPANACVVGFKCAYIILDLVKENDA